MEENLKDTTKTLTEEKALEKETQPGEQTAAQPAAQAAAQQEAPAAQPVYQYAVNPEILPPVKNNENFITQPSKPKKTRGKAAKVIALALCCSLVGGAVGAGTVICLNAYGIGVGPGYKIARMVNVGTGRRMRNNDNQEWSARSDDDRDSFRNRGGNYGSQRKGTGRDSQNFGNDQNRDQDQGRGQQNGGRKDFGQNRQSQGAPNINGKDQGTNQQPDKGSDANNNQTTPPDNAQTKPSDGGEAKN